MPSAPKCPQTCKYGTQQTRIGLADAVKGPDRGRLPWVVQAGAVR